MENKVLLDVKNLHVHYVTAETTAKAVNGIDFESFFIVLSPF